MLCTKSPIDLDLRMISCLSDLHLNTAYLAKLHVHSKEDLCNWPSYPESLSYIKRVESIYITLLVANVQKLHYLYTSVTSYMSNKRSAK
jgi:hypothetical protein